jgi:co-chaperonin GroES (HSP10)
VLVCVDPDDRYLKSESGIILAAGSIERPEMLTGVVVRTGPGIKHYNKREKRHFRQPCEVKPGDRVMFGRGCGHAVWKDGETEHVLISESEHIEGVLEGEATTIRGRYAYSESEVA